MMTSVPPPSTAVQQQPTQPPTIQEFSIRVPKNNKKKHSVMRFNSVLKVNFKEWQHVKLERENNMRDPRETEEEEPKFGAGSEFGKEAREEARKKKFGMISRKYKSEDQPWILKVNGKSGKKFKGVREGGISDNASYYVFTHAPEGAIDAYPLNEWYNFQLIQRYKALTAEEAEEEFNRRNKRLNLFNLMLQKRLRNEEEDGEDADLLENEKKKKTNKKSKDLKISEMEEWIDSDDDNDSDSDDKEDKDESSNNSNKKKKTDVKKKKKKHSSDNEAFEESDDGDEEGRELDYISDSSASESELESQKEMKSVAEEDALRKLLASDEEDEEEDSDKKDEDKSEDDEEKDKNKDDKEKAAKSSDKKKDKKKSVKKESSASSSDNESISDVQKKPNSSQNSRSTTPTIAATTSTPAESLKRNRNSSPDTLQAKRMKTENNYSLSSSFNSGTSESSGLTEDAVRRYLMRKPMTTTELLQKFKSKKTGLTSDQVVVQMTKILKHINPISQKVKDKMYFSLKAQHRQPSTR